ncbi:MULTISPECIES: hypothetical protein [unclassified Nocardia]|uniref:hypothetical protein n=1 Tax=unclassified Nocardia TaxID=2637762 RepID=UPI00341C6F77
MDDIGGKTMRIHRAVLAFALLSAVFTGATACSDEPTETTREAASTTTVPSAPTVLGPLGFGKLRLGMSRSEAEATSEIAAFDDTNDPPGCGRYTARAGWQGFTNKGEIVAIMPGKLPVRTPEGIAVGSTVDEVRAAYPTLEIGYNWSSAAVPDQPARYGFLGIYRDMPADARVTQLMLYNDRDTCHN